MRFILNLCETINSIFNTLFECKFTVLLYSIIIIGAARKEFNFFFHYLFHWKFIFTWSISISFVHTAMHTFAIISVFVGSCLKRLNYFVDTSKCVYSLNKRIILEIKCIWFLFQIFLFGIIIIVIIIIIVVAIIFIPLSTFWNCAKLINDKKHLRYIVLHQIQLPNY